MMIEKKNIDRLFQEKFKNFEAHPSDEVWSNILAAQKQKKERLLIPLWWKIGGVAAGLAILLTISTFDIGDDTKDTPSVVRQESTKSDSQVDNQDKVAPPNISKTEQGIQLSENNTTTFKEEEKTSSLSVSKNNSTPYSPPKNSTVVGSSNILVSASTPKQDENNTTIAVKELKKINISPSIANSKNTQSKIFIAPSIDSNQKAVTQNTTPLQETSDLTKTSVTGDELPLKGKDLVEEAKKIALGENEPIVAINRDGEDGKWNVGAVAAPVYYGDFGGSGLDPRFKDNDKSGDVNLSYGVQLSYAVNSKLKIRGGVSNVDLSYTTNDISFASNNLGRTTRAKDFAQNSRSLRIADKPSKSTAAFEDIASGGNIEQRTNGAIEQRLKYVEVPLEAVYSISDKRIGVAIIGGMSTLLLNNNEVFIQAEGSSQSLGSSAKVKDISFTTNLGIGLDYKITDKLKLNLEPALKYQINGYDDNAGDFKPYYLGVYSGVSFKF